MNEETEEQSRNKSAVIKKGSGSSSKGVQNNIPLSSATGSKTPT